MMCAVLACSASSQAAYAQAVKTPIPPIQTGSGLVAGKVLDSGVKAWLGVPFAKPPVQELRWQPPQPIRWEGTWNADRKMPECIQVLRPHNINHYFGEEPTGEDCLYMNIWAPADSRPGAKLPVIVFFYGGGSTIGSSGMDNYDGETMARRGAVFINLNYRVGILGFLAHPELSKEQGGHSGNYAFLDQNAALRWIRDNVDKFGGDPGKVVITGQSAGAQSVTQQVFSPLSKGLFRGAMMSSGCNWTVAKPTTLAEAEAVGLELQKKLNVASLKAMRDVPADKILAAQAEFQVGVSVSGIRVGAIVDGYFMPSTQSEILQAHAVNDVPIIASFNHDEAGSPLLRAKTVAEYRDIAAKMYGKDADAFLKLYPVSKDSEVLEVAGKVAREQGLESNARNCATLQSQYNKSAAFIDTFSQKHPYAPGVQIADQDPATIGAYHTADIPYWFGTQDAYNKFRVTRNWTAWDRDLSERMSAMLIAFANTGDPSTAKDRWPAWSPQQEVKLEFKNPVGVVALNVKGIEWLKAHPAQPVGGPSGGVGNRIGNNPRD
jgi:para-nitrobenzyl esterase